MITASLLAIAAGLFLFVARRLLRYLQFFQQEEYNRGRFKRWVSEQHAYDKKASAVLLISIIGFSTIGFSSNVLSIVVALILVAALYVIAYKLEEDPRKTGKIKLNMTERATRTYQLALGLFTFTLTVLTAAFITRFNSPSIAWFLGLGIVLIQTTPIWLMLSDRILQPFEQRLQKRFLEEAKSKLRKLDPIVIGITGSYGKTSVKFFLGELLNTAVAPTFYPPKSFNTPMGITREIRERLKPGFTYFVSEMGAYNIGSVARLCDLTPPKASIVTAVGLSHLDRFGSQENIFKAKSELPKVVPADGIAVYNGDNPGSRRMAAEFPKRVTLLYGLHPEHGHLDLLLSDSALGPDGTSFNIHWKGATYPGKTKMFGEAALSNIAAALTMALALGGAPEFLLACTANLEPVDNRLVVKKQGKLTYLNDAYNSNPAGFKTAVDLLRQIPASRRILMTPGMIELGDIQAKENEEIARLAGSFIDLGIIVGSENREALAAGLRSGGLSEDKIICVATRSEAFAKLQEHQQDGDAILIENDLPDLYEANTSF